MKNLTPSWTRITEKRGDNLKKAELNALAVRARDGSEETLLDLWNAVKGFVKKKAVYYAKNHTAGMTTAEDLVQAGFFAVYDTVQAFDETREKSFLTLLKYFLQKRFAEEAGVRTSRRDGLQYADSTAEAPIFERGHITLEDRWRMQAQPQSWKAWSTETLSFTPGGSFWPRWTACPTATASCWPSIISTTSLWLFLPHSLATVAGHLPAKHTGGPCGI